VTGQYDVVIVGTGAGAGTLANVLASAGERILLLERGDFLPREKENWDPEQVFVKGRYISRDTWYDAAGKPFQPQVHYFVGGATKMYGAALYRLRPEDFGEIQHVDGLSPAWPLGYGDFEPWYTRAEWLYQVHGAHGEDPTEGPWSRQYPWPAVSHEPRIRQIADDLRAAGYHPFSAPCGVLLNEADRPESKCIRCNTCDGFPCLVHAKSDAEVIGVRPVLDSGNVTLVVGTVFQKTLGLNDFYFAGEGLDGESRPWPFGNIQMVGKSNAAAMHGEEPKLTMLAPQLSLEEVASHAVDFWLTTEDVPKPDNRVTIDDDGNIRLAYKATNQAEADALYGELRKIMNHIGIAAHHVLDKNFYMHMAIPIAGVAHQAGTCRFGTDPSTSVLDLNCKAHELDNLYVVDASFLPSIGAVNPALTVMANAIRVGEHLLERMG
jgi:choline dehydrogenase-like flavoprotein